MILFTPVSAFKILKREKTVTSRLWKTKRAKPGSKHWAQLNLTRQSRFARLLIKDVWEWNGINATKEFAKREGFVDVNSFLFTYWDLNRHKWDDPDRTHYAIEFEVIQDYQPDPPIVVDGITYYNETITAKNAQITIEQYLDYMETTR